MQITVKRKSNRLHPDASRVIIRYCIPESPKRLIQEIMEFPDKKCDILLTQTLREFSSRHRNISRTLKNYFDKSINIINELKIDPNSISNERQLLIGSYFAGEYSIESAAFFNPSIVEDPDQTNLGPNEKRIIVSFRATGEGHISSVVFRGGIIDKKNNLSFNPQGIYLDEPEFIKKQIYNKEKFINKLNEMNIKKDIISVVMNQLNDNFTYKELTKTIQKVSAETKLSYTKKKVLQAINWLASSHYEISFSLDTAISERVIFPIISDERNGIEDARFVKFTYDDGKIKYYATYTAYNGYAILPKLIETEDFYHFRIMPLHGKYAQNKGMALFPRKINGKYVMLSRIDGINNYIMYSNDINIWENAKIIQKPMQGWELIKIGNSGSPIETEHGWLVITHGVGNMRKYCISAILLDLEDPSKIIGKLDEPLISPNTEEREGYVPNVVYSCGSIIHNNELIIPYAMSDYASTFASVRLNELFNALIPSRLSFKKKEKPLNKFRILIVEDDLIQQKIFYKLLVQEGYEVEVADNGADALLYIGKKKFDIILSDLLMPDMDGFGLIKFLNSKNIKIPVIFITGEEDKESELKGLQLGAVDYLTKPVDKEILLIKLEKFLIKNGLSFNGH
ncbi:MAG: response regulator [Bacteroidales bacterium]|nr:response regulator [Bacteroidales bacterium]